MQCSSTARLSIGNTYWPKGGGTKIFLIVYFSKTGWPEEELPENLSLMPYFGGYPDRVGDHSMNATANRAEYHFRPLTVEETIHIWESKLVGDLTTTTECIYHRMTCKPTRWALAPGLEQIGYYMYHGGNNPRSLVFPGNDPKTTLQESSFSLPGHGNLASSTTTSLPIWMSSSEVRHISQNATAASLLRTWGSVLASK